MSLVKTLFGKLVRWPLSLISPEREVRVLRGQLRGMKWIKGAGPNAYWVGTYEVRRMRTFERAIVPGAVVFDVGANVGIYSLVASVNTGPSGMVYAFEPLERNLRYLRSHVAMNHLQNCRIVEKAVCDREGTLAFATAEVSSSMAHLSPEGEIVVPTTTVDACVYGEERMRPPDVMKIDVEGAELTVLRGAERTIAEFRPKIFLEIHGTQLHADCRDFLLAKGYDVEEGYGELTATPRDVGAAVNRTATA
jgi:FkbM family methyltransferase